MALQPHTPPHFPMYKVHLSRRTIEFITQAVFPKYVINKITQLESGKSYNNRIYMISMESVPPKSCSTDEGKSLILKVVGHYFDHRKVENEVANLLLLKSHCPEIPVPEVFAWSSDGRSIEAVQCEPIEPQEHGISSDHGWILMSTLPGKVLTGTDLDSDHGTDLLRQLAGYVTTWRTNMPVPANSGNLRIEMNQRFQLETTVFQNLVPGRDLVVKGYLLFKDTTSTTLPYYQCLAQDQLSRMKEDPSYEQLYKRLGLELEEWAKTDLPQYPLSQSRNFRFTWMDFAPRNVLVSHTVPPQITGLLDFEFAGFFPVEEEFLNVLRQGGDWEERHWSVILQDMKRLGEKVPPIPGVIEEFGFDKSEWEQACAIAQIVDRIAPWEVRDGSYDTKDLARELDQAEELVRACM